MPRGVPAGGWAAGGPAFMSHADAERYEKLFEQNCHETGFVSGTSQGRAQREKAVLATTRTWQRDRLDDIEIATRDVEAFRERRVRDAWVSDEEMPLNDQHVARKCSLEPPRRGSSPFLVSALPIPRLRIHPLSDRCCADSPPSYTCSRGVGTAEKARSLFMRYKLPTYLLAQIWSVAPQWW